MAGIQFTGLASGLDTESIVKDLMKVERIRVDNVDKEKMTLEMKQEVWDEMNTKLYSFYTEQVFSLKSSGVYKARTTNVSNEDILNASASASAMRGVYTVKVEQLAKAAHLYTNEIADPAVTTSEAMSFTLSDGENTETIELDSGATIADFVAAINNSDLKINANYDTTTGRIFLDSTVTGGTTQIDFTDLDLPAEQSFFESLGFYVNGTGGVSETEAIFYEHTDGTIIDQDAYALLDPAVQADYSQQVLGGVGQDAQYRYNGIKLTSTDNEVSINGLNLTLNAVSSEEVTINVTQNTNEIYDKIKGFVSAYNELLTDINTKLNADSAGDYKPLTDTEKESLDQNTIDLWNIKIKSSLLRRDQTLSSLNTSMRNILTSSVGVDTASLGDGYKYLSELGITTGDYSEQGKLHIEGDITDPTYALKEDKLRAAIEENPEQVADLLSAIGEQLHSMMNDKMKSSSISSALTFYNDKAMTKQIIDYESRIFDLEDYLTSVESRYQSQFSAMEQAIQRMNNQASYFSSMMGGSSQ